VPGYLASRIEQYRLVRAFAGTWILIGICIKPRPFLADTAAIAGKTAICACLQHVLKAADHSLTHAGMRVGRTLVVSNSLSTY